MVAKEKSELRKWERREGICLQSLEGQMHCLFNHLVSYNERGRTYVEIGAKDFGVRLKHPGSQLL